MKYRLLGSSSIRVSELGLGTMTFGTAWGWGADRDQSGRILDLFLDRGGNLVDTASNYTDGESEELLGELLGDRRERIVLATKYTLTGAPDDPNAGGNHRLNLVRSLDRSLRRLRTDRIDEVVSALDDLVAAGKVVAIGISDTPAWVISRAVAIAEIRGWARPAAIQLPYSLGSRDPERELLPMAAGLGLAVTAWGILGGGVLTGKYAGGSSGPRRYGDHKPGEARLRVATAVATVANGIGATPAQVAIAWLLGRRPAVNLVPLLGARTAAQLDENLGALDLELDTGALARLEQASAIPLGFPSEFLADQEVVELIFGRTRSLIDA
jgi:aryl-alcohol dehydrogenase-like predicted oxidoreductase